MSDLSILLRYAKGGVERSEIKVVAKFGRNKIIVKNVGNSVIISKKVLNKG